MMQTSSLAAILATTAVAVAVASAALFTTTTAADPCAVGQAFINPCAQLDPSTIVDMRPYAPGSTVTAANGTTWVATVDSFEPESNN